ncbi:MAG: GNAT family N-acetyltransferase, partial [Rubrivivax sp.]
MPTDPLDAAAPDLRTTEAARWVAIRPLAPRHRPRILAHLLALPLRDRYLRFGYAASDSQVGRYVDQLDFDRDEVFGVFNRRLEVVAMAHLAYMGADDAPQAMAEFGVSVAPHARGRGWGARLFDRAVLHARNRHVDALLIHALAENKAMLHIVRSAGARVELDGPDVVARLPLPPEDFASH